MDMEKAGEAQGLIQIRGKEKGFSFMVAVAFSLNYIMGAGFLTLPWAVHESGLSAGIVVLAFTCLIAVIAAYFVLEALARGEVWEERLLVAKGGNRSSKEMKTNNNTEYESINSVDNVEYIAPSRNSYKIRNLKIELPELVELFIGINGRRIYTMLITIYMYGSLWGYSTVFANAFSTHLPITSEYDTFVSYLFYLIIFAIMVIPATCMELNEQIFFQVLLAWGRVIMILLMVSTIAIAFLSPNPNSFFYPANDHMNSIHNKFHSDFNPNYFNSNNLYILLPVAMYASIFHHSIPGLSEPVRKKEHLGLIYATTLLFCFFAYASISILVASFFGSQTKSSSNLNWESFCRHSYLGRIVSFYIVLFPALDVASAYPLNGITLGNNLMSFYYRDEMHFKEESRLLRIRFRVLAAAPPIIAALFVSDLGIITDYTGLSGFAIALVFPALLSIYSKRKLELIGLPTTTLYTFFLTSFPFALFIFIFGIFLIVWVFFCLTVKQFPIN